MATKGERFQPGIFDGLIGFFKLKKEAIVEIKPIVDERPVQGPTRPGNFSDKALSDSFVKAILKLRREGTIPDPEKY